MKERSAHIPWKAIEGTRDILIHQYFGVDIKEIWQVIKTNIPSLRKEVEDIRSQIKDIYASFFFMASDKNNLINA